MGQNPATAMVVVSPNTQKTEDIVHFCPEALELHR